MAGLKKYSVSLNGHRTSISLEPAFWEQLNALAAAQKKSLQKLIEEIDKKRGGNLSSALRLYVLKCLQERA